MNHYNYQQQLQAVWEHAVAQYRKNRRDPEAMFDHAQTAFLAEIGVRPFEVLDFAEDFVEDGEPDFTTFALIHDLRRYYFRERQQGRFSGHRVRPDELPARDAEAGGIAWLPRIIAKARAKLRGELDPDIMFSCGGDRSFLKKHDIHAAEFLRKTMECEDDDSGIVEWVVTRSNAADTPLRLG